MTSNLSMKTSNPDKQADSGGQTTRLRLVFLTPLGVVTVLIVIALFVMLYYHSQNDIHQGVIKVRTSARDFYEDSIHYDASALQAVMAALKHDRDLNAVLKRGDRQELLRHAVPVFDSLKRDFSITHLYFTGVDRVNLLRVHTPQRFGDTIDRITMLDAERSSTTVYGVELGPLGTFTLRLVSPWYDEQTRELIGYVELGMEIDRVLQKLRDFFGVEVYVLINKQFLQRDTWEAGMHALKRTPDWDRFPSVVVGSQSTQVVPAMIAEHIRQDGRVTSNAIFESVHGGHTYRVAFLPLRDAGNRNVAQMALLTNVSDELDTALYWVYIGTAGAVITGCLLLVFFNWQVGRVGRHIEANERALERLASHDGLTGLYNHRNFYEQLDEEIRRARRYDTSLAVLMLDIDHFKRVNDNYGHPAGDAILRDLSERLLGHVRNIDHVCRYGGEEIAIILPETGADMLVLAERLRVIIEGQPFDAGYGRQVTITVSIGAAHFPVDADNVEALVAVADARLYSAKENGRNKVCASGRIANSS